jgi:hypothetical protein
MNHNITDLGIPPESELRGFGISRQLGNSTEMIDRHYSKYSPLLNAEVHSGRKQKN